MDSQFNKKCRPDAKRFCGLDISGHEDTWKMPIGLVISCLHHRLETDSDDFNEILTEGCEIEVHRMLRLRALDFHLNPDLEESCRADLGRYCSDEMPEKGSVGVISSVLTVE